MSRLNALLPAVLLVVGPRPSVAQAGRGAATPTFAELSRQVDRFVREQMTARHIPGAAVAVVSRGKVVHLEGYGLADVEHEVPVTEHTVFELASVSKQFTATAIMLLVQDGALSLDDTITGVVDSLPTAWSAITIRHLLSHTAGLPDYSRPEFHLHVREEYTPRQLARLVMNAPLDFAPGAKHSYSNTGYALLGMAIEARSGKSYGTFLRQRIFEPLGMRDSRFNDRRAIIPHRARGYSLVDYTLQNAAYTDPSAPYAAGGLVSSAADMATWMQAQGSEKLLTRANWQQLWTEARLTDGTAVSYGLGWYVRHDWSRTRVEHRGGIEGFSNYDARFVEDSLAVVLLSNADVPFGRFGWGLFSIYLPETRYVPPRPIVDTDSATTQLLRRVVTALSQGTGDSAWYTPKVQQYYFPDRIKTRRRAFADLGPLTAFDLLETTDDKGRERRRYRAMFGATPVLFTYWLTPDRRIDDVDFQIE
jgi:D-alanyl-D-alanine carboxypeptidase